MAHSPSNSPLDVLVAIASPAVSRLIVGLLREIGLGEVTAVDSLDFALLQFRHARRRFNLVVCDRLHDGGHLALLTFIRWEQDVVAPSLPVISVGDRWTGNELAANRDAGATVTLALPVTKHALKMSVETAVSCRREFVMASTFRGIDRRCANISGYKGPFRRAAETRSPQADTPRVSVDKKASDISLGSQETPAEASQPAHPDFGWSKAIETGREDIDSQHCGIIEIMNDLNGVAVGNEGEKAAVEKAFAALKDYVRIHFSHEERLMDSFDYDDSTRHKELHAAFVAKIETISVDRICAADTRRKLLVAVYDWLMSHITGIDRIMIAKLNGEYGTVGNDPKETQTTIVIDNAHKIVRNVQKMSVRLSGIPEGPPKTSLRRHIAEAMERFINLMGLATTRVETVGCNSYHLRRLGDVRAALNTNADSMAEDAARNLIDYGNTILSGNRGIPLGIGAILSKKRTRMQSLVQIVGGSEAMRRTTRDAVEEAMRVADAVLALEFKGFAEFPQQSAVHRADILPG